MLLLFVLFFGTVPENPNRRNRHERASKQVRGQDRETDGQREWHKQQGEELTGTLEQSSTLQIIYDPARLPFIRLTRNGLPAWGIDATVRFHPGVETYAAGVVKNLAESGSGPRIPVDPVPAPMNVMVPPDAMAVEMWFANTDIYGATSWDSRYGQNYWFQVAQAGPAR